MKVIQYRAYGGYAENSFLAADAVRHLIEGRPFGCVLMRVGTDARLKRSGNPL
jgi:hypothetical protein